MNFRNLFDRHSTRPGKPRRRRSSQRALRRHLGIETLESRRLLVIGAFNPAPLTGRGNGFDGVVGIDLNGDATTTSVDSECSGTLLNSGRHILTASHCEVTTADMVIFDSSDSAAGNFVLMQPSAVTDHPSYNGDTAFGNDVTVLELPALAPAFADRYNLFRGNNELAFPIYTMAGFGGDGVEANQTAGGTVRRFAGNNWEQFGDPANGNLPPGTTLRSDFDDGTAGNNLFGDLGVPGNDGFEGRGDSGGPGFLNVGGQLQVAGITSFGGTNFGTQNVDTRVSSFQNFIDGITTATHALNIDFQFQPAFADDGIADTITLRRFGTNIDVIVSGIGLIHTEPMSQVSSIVIDASSDNDQLVVDYSQGPIDVPITFNGGGQQAAGGDSLRLVGGNFTTITHNFSNENDGNVDLDGQTITYTGLEPIFDNLGAVNRVFTYSGVDETITLSDDGFAGNNVSRIDSTAGEVVDFLHPTNSLTINGGAGADVINLNAVDNTTVIPNLIVNGDAGNDTINGTPIAAGTFNNVTLNGGDDNDTINGTQGVETVNGGGGDDIIVGNRGNDLLNGDGGSDRFTWNNGDGADDIVGGALGDPDIDFFTFNGATNPPDPNDADILFIQPANFAGFGGGDGTLANADFDVSRFAPSAFTIELASIEDATINGLNGTDTMNVADLSGRTDLTNLRLNGNNDNDTFNVQMNSTVQIDIDGGSPVAPALPGDTLNIASPNELNVFSDKANNVTMTSTIGGAPTAPVIFTSIETTNAFAGNGVVNLLGDNNDFANFPHQTDHYVVTGQDVDFNLGGDPDGVNELSLVINGNNAIGIANVFFLNANGNAQGETTSTGVDTLAVSPYADDIPRGWGIDVTFNEGLPAQTDGSAVDLLIYNTATGGGQVSEHIEVKPSGPDNGELVVTNASFGTPIVDIDYIGNTDIIINDNDGFVNDTDTLTLHGTDGTTPQTSGRDLALLDFDTNNTVAVPVVRMFDAASNLILYRVQTIVGIETVNFDFGDGDDQLRIAGPDNDATPGFAINPIRQINYAGGNGDDQLTLDLNDDEVNGFSINFDGGNGRDSISAFGTPVVTVNTVTYTVGDDEGSGQIVANDGTAPNLVIDFQNLEPVVWTVPATDLVINANNADNAINYTAGANAANGLVSIDGFESFEFAGQTNLTINALAGSDTVNLNYQNPAQSAPTGLTGTITVNGGDPTGSDTLIANGQVGVLDVVNLRPTQSGQGQITNDAPQPAVNYTGIEDVEIVVQETDNDGLRVGGTTGNDTLEFTPGATIHEALISGVLDENNNTGNGPFRLPNVTLTGFSATAGFGLNNLAVGQGGSDTTIFNGSSANDIFTVANELVTLSIDGQTAVRMGNTGASTTNRLVINAHAGDDTINLTNASDATLSFDFNGGDPSNGSDVLNLNDPGANQTVVIAPDAADPTQQDITGFSANTIDVTGTELITYTAANSAGGARDDTLILDPLGADGSFRVENQVANTTPAPSVPIVSQATSDLLPEVHFTGLQTFQINNTLLAATNPGAVEATFVTLGLDPNTLHQLTAGPEDVLTIEGADSNQTGLVVAEDLFIVRNPATIASGNQSVLVTDANSGVTVRTPAGNGRFAPGELRLNTLGGDDIVDVDAANKVVGLGPNDAQSLDLIDTVIVFDGGTGADLLIVDSAAPGPATNVTNTVYTPGPDPTSGKLDFGTVANPANLNLSNPILPVGLLGQMQIEFTNLQPVQVLTPAANLVVNGTNGDDVFTYSASSNPTLASIAVNGTEVINAHNQSSYTLAGFAGNDRFDIQNANPIGLGANTPAGTATPVGVVVRGGSGDDVIDASANTNAIPMGLYGGPGNDTITGGAANDFIYGGAGNDTLINSPGNDTFDGALGSPQMLPPTLLAQPAVADIVGVNVGFDTLVYQGTPFNDIAGVYQLPTAAAANLTLNFQTTNPITAAQPLETDNLATRGGVLANAGGLSTVEEVRMVGDRGNDILQVQHDDAYVNPADATAVPGQMVRFAVEGDAPNSSDTLVVVDNGAGDLTLIRQAPDERSGRITMAPAINAGLGEVIYSGIERVDILPATTAPPVPLGGGIGGANDGTVVVFDGDPHESNDILGTARDFGELERINRSPNIDHNFAQLAGSGIVAAGPADNDWFVYTAPTVSPNGITSAPTNQTVAFNLIHNVIPAVASGRPGLPGGGGQLGVSVYNAAGLLLSTAVAPSTLGVQNVQAVVSVAAGTQYFVRVFGNTNLDINTYDLRATEVDLRGPQVTAVNLTNNPAYNVFGIKPGTPGSTTPLIGGPAGDSITISFGDLPSPRAPGNPYSILDPVTAAAVGNYQLIGDANGIVPIGTVTIVTNPNPAGVNGGTATVRLTFPAAIPDDRYTLIVLDGVRDPAGNRLDGESNASQPNGGPAFPSGDTTPGGNFVARFTVDSRAEIGTWGGGSVWVDINGNNFFDPNNTDSVNRDITFVQGVSADDIFAGEFAGNPGFDGILGTPDDLPIDNFDKLASYGNIGNTLAPNGQLIDRWRWQVDVNHDGVPDIQKIDPNGFSGHPVAGDFDLFANGGFIDDEVAVFSGGPLDNGRQWGFDVNHDYLLDTFIVIPGMSGLPIIGDFNGDGNDDLGAWSDDTFQVALANGPWMGVVGTTPGFAPLQSFKFGFPGVREVPVAADFDGDGWDDIGLWVPDRPGVTPGEGGEWYIFNSANAAGVSVGVLNRIITDPTTGDRVVRFTPTPFGTDIYAQFGDDFARPIAGNFDPPVGTGFQAEGVMIHTNVNNPFDVNADGLVTPADVLAHFNAINNRGSIPLDYLNQEKPFYDSDANGIHSPADALATINFINAGLNQSGSAEGESNGGDSLSQLEPLLLDVSLAPTPVETAGVDDSNSVGVDDNDESLDVAGLLADRAIRDGLFAAGIAQADQQSAIESVLEDLAKEESKDHGDVVDAILNDLL